jgi:hypothetical protein
MQGTLLYRHAQAQVYAGNEKRFILSETSIARMVSLTSRRRLLLIRDLFSDSLRHPLSSATGRECLKEYIL